MMPDRPNRPAGDPALQVSPGTAHAPSINPAARRRPRPTLPVQDYVDGILRGDRGLLSRAITLVESTRPEHRRLAQDILDRCMPETGRSIRVGITGVPGVGKSTFIEALGTHLTRSGHRLAVLAIDPSSARSGGSILGDKTRMPELSRDPNAFIRPSPTGGSLGGVARSTRETMLLCEAAGFDVIFVETVGVGQSETTVASMVDFFLLLVLAGAGDELQGIKRGIMEMADAIAVNKADGPNRAAALEARRAYQSALRLFPPAESGWSPQVLTCSALTGEGIPEVWATIEAYRAQTQASGFFARKRREQVRLWMHQVIEERLRAHFFSHPAVRDALPTVEADVMAGRLAPTAAAERLLAAYEDRS
ncbi:methylmalonyl Co-A mutase-associated GTPase MeaB [Rhodothermaceae bacterium RA]|nr:methylmalonyl Co-A mutase-associated GTPase MeaB [Rhodothermaceae bacterium RA]